MLASNWLRGRLDSSGAPSRAQTLPSALNPPGRSQSANGTAKHIYTKLGRGAVIIFDVDSHETLHKLINQWSECVPATFEVHALLPKEHQERIAKSGTNPMSL